MRAVGVMDYGGPEALRVLDLPAPEIRPGRVRIRVHAAAVSPTDTYVRNGARAKGQQAAGPPPYVPGMDVAGVVDELGEGVGTDLALGDRVMAIVVPRGAHGGYAEQVVVPAESVARQPAGCSDAEAATLPMNGLTARLALDKLGLRPGQRLGVTGAAGTLGGYVVQLAKADGLQVLADASEADEHLVRQLGADAVVRRGADVAKRFREVAPDGVDGLVDAALLHDAVVPAVVDGGRIMTVRGYAGDAARGVTFVPVWVTEYAREQAKLDRLRQQVEAGELTLRVAGVYPAERAAEAHRLLEAGGVRGRLVIEF